MMQLLLGGGELLNGHRGFNSSLNVWSKLANKKGIPIFLLGVSGDTNMPEYILKRNKDALKRFNLISVRDGSTKDIMNNYYNVECDWAPDVVFAYKQICEERKIETEKENILMCVPIQYNKLIKENMQLTDIEKYYDYLITLVKDNLKNVDKIIITISVLEDQEFSKKFYDYAQKKLVDIPLEYVDYSNLDDYITLVKQSSIVISGRMHALILALINNNKVVPIPFKEKLKCFGKEYCEIEKIEPIEEKVIEEFEKIKNIINL